MNTSWVAGSAGEAMSEWGVYDTDDGAEVRPVAEYEAHEHSDACACGPRVLKFENERRLIVHNRMDN